MEELTRFEMLVGSQAIKSLAHSHVAVFGIGGVGSYAVEALCRSGIGTLTVVDGDVVSQSNINRQLYALHSTVGLFKTEVAKARCRDINPSVKVNAINVFFSDVSKAQFNFADFDYVIDAVDSVSAKVLLAKCCQESGTPIISAMGAGNKFDATLFKVGDIFDTTVCPLARIMRHELKSNGIQKLKVVYSTEKPVETSSRTPGSTSFVPPVCGFVLAGEVIKDLINNVK